MASLMRVAFMRDCLPAPTCRLVGSSVECQQCSLYDCISINGTGSIEIGSRPRFAESCDTQREYTCAQRAAHPGQRMWVSIQHGDDRAPLLLKRDHRAQCACLWEPAPR